MTTGSLVVPEATVTVEADDVGCSDEDKVGRTEGLEPMETLATVATGKTIVEVDPADEEDVRTCLLLTNYLELNSMIFVDS